MLNQPRVSAVLPAFNEVEAIPSVVEELATHLGRLEVPFEIVVVDDGSTDGMAEALESVRGEIPQLSVVRLRRNFGKSIALRAGFDASTGDVIVLMDADGQDDPAEIPGLLRAIDDGLHLVTGRRVERRDRFVKRTTSMLFNAVTARVSGVPGKDFNSGLKAMRREVADTVNLYGELHRYIPVLAHWAGFRVGEVPVNHRPRRAGVTKFGGARFWRGMLDLLTVQFLIRFTARPLHLFGGMALLIGLAGTGLLAWMTVLRLMGEGVGNRPALLAGILLVLVAVQLFSIGLLAEFFAHARGKVDVSAMIAPPDPPNPTTGENGRTP